MNGRVAGLSFIAVCLILAALLLTGVIGRTTSASVFAVALVVLGGASRGFRK